MTFSDAVSSAISEREWLDTTTGQSAVELLQNNFPPNEVVRRVISASDIAEPHKGEYKGVLVLAQDRVVFVLPDLSVQSIRYIDVNDVAEAQGGGVCVTSRYCCTDRQTSFFTKDKLHAEIANELRLQASIAKLSDSPTQGP